MQWCTGYSEPGSGSDLASLQCKAVRDGEHYVVNGQKIWTSVAMWAKWMILLVRTGGGAGSKHDGITCLLVEMQTPGITVRPIRNMSGSSMFAEVFFDGVRVPVENRLGAEGEGWQVTVSALAFERSSISEVYGLARQLDGIKELARRSLPRRPARLARIPRSGAGSRPPTCASRRCGSPACASSPSSSAASRSAARPRSTSCCARSSRSSSASSRVEIQGSRGALMKGEGLVPDDGRWQRLALSWPEVVIGGGTPNIQRNIIAERVLGLPKD